MGWSTQCLICGTDLYLVDKYDDSACPGCFCPDSDDNQHCNCWYDGEKCCRCGEEQPE